MIIDASVAFKWFAREEGSDAALKLLDGRLLQAPILLMHEVANALWKMARRQQIDGSVSFAKDIARLPQLIELVNESELVAMALEIGRVFDHPVYDCIYLALAEAQSDQIVTADSRLLNKFKRSIYADYLVPLEVS